MIPIQIGTLHAQVCKSGHQWKYGKFRNYAIMQSRRFTGFRRCHQRFRRCHQRIQLKRTVRWLMSVVNCATFKRRCAKSLSTVICHGVEPKMRFAIAAPVTWSCLTDGGSIYRNLRLREKREYGVRLMNTFYPKQTALRPSEFAEVISMTY